MVGPEKAVDAAGSLPDDIGLRKTPVWGADGIRFFWLNRVGSDGNVLKLENPCLIGPG